jgi:futalosine hydrolase
VGGGRTSYGRWRADSVPTPHRSEVDALILVPTEAEAELLGDALPGPVRVCGFGLAAAGAGAAHAIATHPEDAGGGVVLAGAAGTYDLDRLPIGTAVDAGGVRIDGIGAGGVGPAALGFAESDVLVVDGDGGELLSVAEAAATPADAAARAGRHPTAVGEEMEGFAVAVAAALFGVQLRIVRGASNVAGDRDHASWRMADALSAVRETLRELA